MRVPGWLLRRVLLPGWLAGAAFLFGPSLGAADHRGRQFIGWERFADWDWRRDPTTNRAVLTSPPVQAGIEWNEAVLSWNADTPPGTGLRLELRRLEPAPATRFYVMGLWASDPAEHPRESVRGQKDEYGQVQTDTLVLRQPAQVAQVRITLTSQTPARQATLKFVGLSLLDTRIHPEPLPPNRNAWGRELAVPERSQVIYPEGVSAWCSPTSLAMLLAYWAKTLPRPELDLEVPAVARAVHDPEWPGTGNWVFNTAFAGSFPGMRGYVTRLSDVSELEDWIIAGVPVAVSVSYNLLRGKPRDRADGHLVVLRGFNKEGEAIVNDPGTGQEIRRVFRREDLARAWAVSQNTIYVIHPIGTLPPGDRFQHWQTPRSRGAWP